MSRFMSFKWVLALTCVTGITANGVAFGHGGGGHSGGGHSGGGGHMGGSHMGGGHTGGGAHMGGGHHYVNSGHHYGGTYGGFGGFYGGIGGLGFYGGSPGYGYGNYGAGNGYYYTQPVYSQPVYTPTVYGQPVYSNSVSTSNFPVLTSPPVTSSASQVVYDNGEIVLFSPPGNTQDVQYILNGTAFTMKPGTMQKFTNDRTWTIDVNMGSGQTVKYTLSTGYFKFKQSESGVGLFSTKDQPEVAAPVPESLSTEKPETKTPAPMPAE